MSKFKKGQLVYVYTEGKVRCLGIVQKILPHPYTPSWLDFIIKPNYLVRFFRSNKTEVFKQKELI